MKRKSYVTQQHSLALSSATGASTEIALVFWEGISAQDRLILWKSGGVSVINASHPGKNVGFMASATFRANDTAALHINGQTNNANAAFLTDNMSTASRLTIGCRATSDTTFTQGFDGYIAEIIVYNRALKSSERKQIENYLSNKFAIKI